MSSDIVVAGVASLVLGARVVNGLGRSACGGNVMCVEADGGTGMSCVCVAVCVVPHVRAGMFVSVWRFVLVCVFGLSASMVGAMAAVRRALCGPRGVTCVFEARDAAGVASLGSFGGSISRVGRDVGVGVPRFVGCSFVWPRRDVARVVLRGPLSSVSSLVSPVLLDHLVDGGVCVVSRMGRERG